jgi:4-amino-4-deoxy-L-arabinose transferase-like glycosyltransferase
VTVTERTPGREPETVERRSTGSIMRGGGIPLLVILLVAAALRFATLDTQSFSDDELFTVWLAKMHFGDLLSTVPDTEATPHLFYVLEWLSTRVFGSGEVGARLLPALAGLLTVPAVYAAGTIGASRRVGLAAAAFVAVNPFLIWYSQEARAYALLILLSAVSLVYLLAHARWAGKAALAGWAITAAAALATHYFAVFLVLPEAVWLLARGPGPMRQRLYAVAVPALAALALLPLALHQRNTVGDPGGLGDLGFGERVAAIPKNFLVGFSIPAEAVMVTAAGLAAAVALVLALRAGRRAAGDGVLIAFAVAVCGLAVPLVIAPLFDYVSSRNLVATLVPAAVVLGWGFVQGVAGKVALGVICVVSIATVMGVAASPEYQRRDWRGAAQALGPAKTERLLVFSPPFHNPGPFGIYYGSGNRLAGRSPVRVGEVAIVALGDSRGFGPDKPKPPGGPAPAPPPGFREAEDVTTKTYRLVRFTSVRPRPVSLNYLSAASFPGAPSVPVLQSRER